MDQKEQEGRYTKYLLRMPLSHSWPCALLENLKIEEKWRRRKYGRMGLQCFLEEAKARGAVCAILKVGWTTPPEDPDKARLWKAKFYSSEGFIELDVNDNEPVMMYKSLV